ncbi:MAG: response regulator [Lachnospiraceae bacterium]|nr:response regulator [Lachnospiraceae bacterium]
MKKILIIDDSPFIYKEVAATLEGLDYEVIGHAKSGEEGIAMVQELQPEIITLDIVMPGIDGIETAQKLIEIAPNTKIVMLSSLCDHDTVSEVESLGLKYLVSKPIEKEVLIETLEKVCKE